MKDLISISLIKILDPIDYSNNIINHNCKLIFSETDSLIYIHNNSVTGSFFTRLHLNFFKGNIFDFSYLEIRPTVLTYNRTFCELKGKIICENNIGVNDFKIH